MRRAATHLGGFGRWHRGRWCRHTLHPPCGVESVVPSSQHEEPRRRIRNTAKAEERRGRAAGLFLLRICLCTQPARLLVMGEPHEGIRYHPPLACRAGSPAPVPSEPGTRAAGRWVLALGSQILVRRRPLGFGVLCDIRLSRDAACHHPFSHRTQVSAPGPKKRIGLAYIDGCIIEPYTSQDLLCIWHVRQGMSRLGRGVHVGMGVEVATFRCL